MTYKDEIETNRRTAWKAIGFTAVTAATGGTFGTIAWLDARNNPQPVVKEPETPEDDQYGLDDSSTQRGLYTFEQFNECIDYSSTNLDRDELESFASEYDNLGILIEPISSSNRYHGTFYEVAEDSDELVKDTKLPYGIDNIKLEDGCLEDL